MDKKEINKAEELSSSSAENKKTKIKKNLNSKINENTFEIEVDGKYTNIEKTNVTPNTSEIGEKTEIKITLSEDESTIVERKFIITGNVLGFNNEYYTLLNPEIKANSNDLERIAFLENLIKFKMIKEIK